MPADPANKSNRPSQTWDTLIEKAFAPQASPDSSPTLRPVSLKQTETHELQPRPPSSVYSPSEAPMAPQDVSLDPLWEQLREVKSRVMATLPSKVPSLEAAPHLVAATSSPAKHKALVSGQKSFLGDQKLSGPVSKPLPSTSKVPQSDAKPLSLPTKSFTPASKQPRLAQIPIIAVQPPSAAQPPARIRPRVQFMESADGQMVTATFDMPGVKKQDMHVSFRAHRVVVSWRRVKVTERMEGATLVRERQEKQYCETIPLPAGTTFDEIRAARHGGHLTLTYPNINCTRILSNSDGTELSGDTEFYTCKPPQSTIFMG